MALVLMSSLDRFKAYEARQKEIGRCRRYYFATPAEHEQIKKLLKDIRVEFNCRAK